MSDEPIDGVMGSLPRTRPHRRSAKRGPATKPVPSPTAASQPAKATSAAKGNATPAAKGKATPAAKGNATPAAKGNATPAAKGNATPAAKGKRKPAPAAPRKAKTLGAGGTAGAAGTPARSLPSATAPRATSDRSRKPGATSPAHHKAAARPVRPPVGRRSVPPAAEPAGAVGTAMQAAAELIEIGLKAGARALRGALARLPRP